MPVLPPIGSLTPDTTTNTQARAWFTDLRAFLADLLGTAGTIPDALAKLGALVSGVRTMGAAGSVTAADRGRLLICSAAPWNLTLPLASTVGAGFAFLGYSLTPTGITLVPSGSDTFDASATPNIGRPTLVVCTGTGWTTIVMPVRNGQVVSNFGNAAAPGFCFTNDTDSGMFLVGANVLGLAAGGTEIARLTAAGMQLTGLLTGTAVMQTLSDTTVGRLMTTGAFGLGLSNGNLTDIADLDAHRINGFFRWSSAAVGNPVPTSAGVLIHIGRLANTEHHQIGMTNAGRIFYRRWVAGSWVPWREVYHAGTILGSVAQSGGVPTGAWAERGSNANGEFVRYADGRLECRVQVGTSLAIDQAFMGGFRSAGQTWTFPATFIAAPDVTVTPMNLTAFGGIVANTPGVGSCSWAVTAVTTQTATTRSVSLQAVGRWY